MEERSKQARIKAALMAATAGLIITKAQQALAAPPWGEVVPEPVWQQSHPPDGGAPDGGTGPICKQ